GHSPSRYHHDRLRRRPSTQQLLHATRDVVISGAANDNPAPAANDDPPSANNNIPLPEARPSAPPTNSPSAAQSHAQKGASHPKPVSRSTSRTREFATQNPCTLAIHPRMQAWQHPRRSRIATFGITLRPRPILIILVGHQDLA